MGSEPLAGAGAALALLPLGLGLGLVLLTLALLGMALRGLRALRAETAALAAELDRALAIGRQQAERLAALDRLREAQTAAEEAIATGQSLVREVHRGIADIPFEVLDAIPATRDAARRVRGVHDAITDGVYDALAGLNRRVGRELRRPLATPEPAPKPDGGGTDGDPTA